MNRWCHKFGSMHKLNEKKTKLMPVTSQRTMHLNNIPTSITIFNAQIPFKQSVKKLSLTLDCTMNAHVSNIARSCYHKLRRLASIRRFMTNTATATIVSAFALSRIDNRRLLLFRSTHDVTPHLKRIQNYAARVILRLTKSSSISTHPKSLILVSCQSKKQFQNSLFVLPLPQQYYTIICRRHAAE